jgi:hypothetical protein
VRRFDPALQESGAKHSQRRSAAKKNYHTISKEEKAKEQHWLASRPERTGASANSRSDRAVPREGVYLVQRLNQQCLLSY